MTFLIGVLVGAGLTLAFIYRTQINAYFNRK